MPLPSQKNIHSNSKTYYLLQETTPWCSGRSGHYNFSLNYCNLLLLKTEKSNEVQSWAVIKCFYHMSRGSLSGTHQSFCRDRLLIKSIRTVSRCKLIINRDFFFLIPTFILNLKNEHWTMGVSPVIAVDFEFHSFTFSYWARYFVKVIRDAQTQESILAQKFAI